MIAGSLALALALAASRVPPADYWEVGRSPGGSLVKYVDARTRRTSKPGAVRATFVLVLDAATEDRTGALYAVAEQEFDCREATVRTFTQTAYDKNDTALGGAPPLPEPSAIVPDTPEGMGWRMACAQTKDWPADRHVRRAATPAELAAYVRMTSVPAS